MLQMTRHTLAREFVAFMLASVSGFATPKASFRGPSMCSMAASIDSSPAVGELRDMVAKLERRIEAIEANVAASQQARIEAMEAELSMLRQGRIQALEAELASLLERRREAQPFDATDCRQQPKPSPSDKPIDAAQNAASEPSKREPRNTIVARAALGAVTGTSAFSPPSNTEAQNDAFLDDDLEELLEIGGDPTFLEQARESLSPPPTRSPAPSPSKEFEWDGVIDDTAHFDD